MKFRLEPKKLGKLLSELRQKAGLSQAKISKVCEVNSPQYISNIERGQCLPSLKILKTMLAEYNVDTENREYLIDMFVQSAVKEIESIFNTKLEINYKVIETDLKTNQYVDTPTLNYSLAGY